MDQAAAVADAGAVGAIIVSNDDTLFGSALLTRRSEVVGIPVLMVPLNEGERLKALDSSTVIELTGRCYASYHTRNPAVHEALSETKMHSWHCLLPISAPKQF